MELHLPPETEAKLKKQAAAAGMKLDELVLEAVEDWADRVADTSSEVTLPEWNEELNARRCVLIDKEIQEVISDDEQRELTRLTHQLRAYRDQVAPVPIEGAKALHRQLLAGKQHHLGNP